MLTKEEFVEKLRTRENGKYNYLYQVGVLATANENYVKYAYEYIVNNEINDGELKGIKQITRKSYKVKHAATATVTGDSNRGEEWFVLDMFRARKEEYVKKVFGNILDYQIPLKSKRNDKGVGKIDFMFEKGKDVYIAEIKADYSKESVLKAIVEIQTYYQIVDKEMLLSSFGKAANTNIKKAIVLFDGTKGAEQVRNDKNVKDLLAKFDIETIIIKRTPMFEKVN